MMIYRILLSAVLLVFAGVCFYKYLSKPILYGWRIKGNNFSDPNCVQELYHKRWKGWCTMTITERAEKWIADSGDDTEEFKKRKKELKNVMEDENGYPEYAEHHLKAMFTAGHAEAAEIMVGLMAEIEREHNTAGDRDAQWWQGEHSRVVTELMAKSREVDRLKLQLSGRTYCHSDEAVEKDNTKMREVLGYLMDRFEHESWECPTCGHSEDTATMDSADYLRKFLAKQHKR